MRAAGAGGTAPSSPPRSPGGELSAKGAQSRRPLSDVTGSLALRTAPNGCRGRKRPGGARRPAGHKRGARGEGPGPRGLAAAYLRPGPAPRPSNGGHNPEERGARWEM